jgi:signal transduction histidine kinase
MVVRTVSSYGPHMRPRFRVLLANRRIQIAADSALAGAILVASLFEIASGADEWSGPRQFEVALAVLCSLPLIWRRSRTVPVAAIVVSAALATSLVVAPTQGPFESFVAIEIALYSVGVYVASRAGAAVLAVTTLAGLGALLTTERHVSGVNAGDWLPILVWAWGVWAVGRVIRSHTLRSAELERLARELAAERDSRAREAVTVERARIARELHDVVAHKISVMGVQAAAARRVLTGEQPVIRQALAAIESTGRETIDEMRHMLGVLRDHSDELALAPQPGLRDLAALAVQMRAAGLPVDIQIEGEPRALPAGLELSAYRIVQEGLTNTLKHAGPSRASVAVRYLDRAVELEIVDDGPGGAASDGTGNGLIGMRERVAMFGGELDAGRRAEGGWSLRARLPVTAT